LGQYVKFQADVSASAGTPYGYVYFSGPNFTSPSLPLQTTGNVTSTVSWVATNLSLGFYPVSAYYSSTSGHQPSFGNVFQNVMDSYFIPTSTQLLTSSNPASVSSDVTFTAQIASFPEATGTVDFYRVDATFGPILMGSSQASLVANVTQASFTIPASALGVGSHQIHANFLGGWSGNFSFQASTGILTQDVVSGLAPTITSLASDPNPSTSGQTVLFTAFVSSTAGSPTGLVRFSDGAQTLGFGNVTPNGPFTALATLSVPLVGVGNHSVTAEYLPTGAFAGSNSSVLVQQVQSAPPFLAISDVSVVEGNTATSTATFVVTLSAAQGTDVTVGYTTGGGTATAGSDYLASSGTVTFAAGQTTRPVDLTIVGDTTYEPDETFEVTLSSPVGAVIGDGVGVGTILNDDPPPGPSRVFVSVDGLDTNDCSNVLTPCRTLNAAIAQVAEHGEVIIIKSGSYAGATITKSVKVTAAAGVVAFSGQPITVNAGASAIVAIRGLTLKAVTPGTGNGLLIQSAAAVFLENSVIDGWAVGVYRAGAAEAFIKDSVIRNNGTGLFATGKTTVENTRLSNNSIGIATSLSKLSLRGSTVSGSASEGILADLQSDVSVEKCQISNNGVGVKLPLATSHVRLSRSVVSGNGIGLENVAGMLEVSGNNVIRGNSTNTSGAVTFVPLQ
jgi:hypothetical protein